MITGAFFLRNGSPTPGRTPLIKWNDVMAMLEVILGAAKSFFAIVGFTEVWNRAKERFLLPGGRHVSFIISLKGHEERIEYTLRTLVFKMRGISDDPEPMVIVIDLGMDEETKKICEVLAEELGCVRICSSKELPLVVCGENP